MNITLYQEQSDLPIDETSVEQVVKEVLSFNNIHRGELILHFVSKEEITDLHDEFFQDPTPTDCITFPIDPIDTWEIEESPILGEIFVCPQVGKEYSPENPYFEVTLYIIHGILHLLGYDDLTDEDALLMRAAEKNQLEHLEKKNLAILPSNLIKRTV